MSERRLHPFATPTAFSQSRVDQRFQHRRSLTPNGRIPSNSARLLASIEGDLAIDEDPRLAIFKDLYARSEIRLASLFEHDQTQEEQSKDVASDNHSGRDHGPPGLPLADGSPTLKRKARAIDEDDYGEDESDGDELNDMSMLSPLKLKGTNTANSHPLSSTAMLRNLSNTSTPTSSRGALPPGKTTEAARKKLEADKKATEDAAKRTSHTLFYTLENDRDAMLEQKKLEESDRKVDAELGGANSNGQGGSGQPGSLSQTNLGASNLTLKNLIRRIDEQRDKVGATDSELRTLMSEVRKNRSKWASEEKVGQEELYESCEKVLSELKGQTEHSTHFLNKVNKKEAPDYANIIKHPMDLGTMTKKLKNFQYKSKREFVDDLMLIWANCLKYNANPDHYMRKHALFMRKETEKLVPLINDIVIRDRAEIEAEDRRLQQSGPDVEGDEDSDDEPIISSRGRKAPSKKSKKGVKARKAPAAAGDRSPTAPTQQIAAEDITKADSENGVEGSQTPPHGTATPTGINGLSHHGSLSIQGDAMDIDGDSMINGIASSDRGFNEEPEYEDVEYKTWKQVTKKDRATVTSERHRLFKGDRLDRDAPALIRTKAGMRSWLRKQTEGEATSKSNGPVDFEKESDAPKGETLAEGMEGDEEKILPDYYDSLSAIPDIPFRIRWVEDSQGQLLDFSDEFLHQLPRGLFLSTESSLSKRIHDNIYQVQKTRKITAKIGIVKQMALQTQLYQGQFQKTDIVPLNEQDIEAHVASESGPAIASETSRAALQRCIAKLLVHAGFEEYQPSALDAFTDLAGDYFQKIAETLCHYSQAPKVPCAISGSKDMVVWQTRFNADECILHTLKENGMDLEALDFYVNEDIDRTGTRLSTTYERMKAHLADLIRPALQDAGPDGSGAFNDGSEQFISGDFAEELGDDFFGFKELGLDAEFGDASMSVPLHLLQKSMFQASQAQNSSSGASNAPSALPDPEPLSPITTDNVKEQIGLVHDFFMKKLRDNNDTPLIEDDELPVKLRMPKPRLPPNGKITSPRKRPFKEPGPGKGHPRKKMRPAEGDSGNKGQEQDGHSGEQSLGDTNGTIPKSNEVMSETMSREPSKVPKPPSKGNSTSMNVTNGTSEAGLGSNYKGKNKIASGDSGQLPSPESLEAS